MWTENAVRLEYIWIQMQSHSMHLIDLIHLLAVTRVYIAKFVLMLAIYGSGYFVSPTVTICKL